MVDISYGREPLALIFRKKIAFGLPSALPPVVDFLHCITLYQKKKGRISPPSISKIKQLFWGDFKHLTQSKHNIKGNTNIP